MVESLREGTPTPRTPLSNRNVSCYPRQPSSGVKSASSMNISPFYEEDSIPISTVQIRNVVGTQAAMGWADGHTLVVDRPMDRAGGMGLGFNGAQLLALTIGGCFANDLRYLAADLDRPVGDIAITVAVSLDGSPIRATAAEMTVTVSMLDGSDPRELVEKAKMISMAMNSISRGLPVLVNLA